MRREGRAIVIRSVALLLGAALFASAGRAEDTDPESNGAANDGQDATRPVRRIDLRPNFTKRGRSGEYDAWSYTLRHDRPVPLGNGWKLGLRIDLPLLYNNLPTDADPAGSYRVGFGDVLGQAVLIRTFDARMAVGAGTQVIVRTGGGDQFGSGLWRLVPMMGLRYKLPEISAESFVTGAMRYDVDVAGPDRNGHVRSLQFSPTFNIGLPDRMFLTLFPSYDIRYNFLSRSWFVPLDVQFGKVWSDRIVTSLEIGAPIYYTRGTEPVYRFKLEGQIGFFF